MPCRSSITLIAILFTLFSFCASRAETAQESATAIAEAAGLSNFGEVEEIGFTFNLQTKAKSLARVWKWWPKEDRVQLTDESGKVTEYSRKDADLPKKIDGWFVNDQYWLLFPMHLAWDPGTKLETFAPGEEVQALIDPSASGLRVTYDSERGYTPGDIYELFYTPNHRIVRWVFRKGGRPADGPGMSWEGYEKIGPLMLSIEHQGADGFRLWFTNVTVK